MAMEMRFFETSPELREWLREHHATAGELWIGFHRKGSGRKSITYREAVDEALCFGWIDGVRKTLDETSYAIRFSPRKPGSLWSGVNIKRVQELKARGLLETAGLAAFRKGSRKQPRVSPFEVDDRELSAAYEEEFRAKRPAWDFFRSQSPGFQRTARWWVMSAPREETRRQRLRALIEECAQGAGARRKPLDK